MHATHGKKTNYEFIYLDQEIAAGDVWPTNMDTSTIHEYYESTLMCDDLYSKDGPDSEICLIKMGQTKSFQTRPKQTAYVQLGCPNALLGTGECSNNQASWRCSKCKELVEYGIDILSFYCKCGQTFSEDSLKCSNCRSLVDYDMDTRSVNCRCRKSDLRNSLRCSNCKKLLKDNTGAGSFGCNCKKSDPIDLLMCLSCEMLVDEYDKEARSFKCSKCKNVVDSLRCSVCKELVTFSENTGPFYCKCGKSDLVDSLKCSKCGIVVKEGIGNRIILLQMWKYCPNRFP